MRLFPKGEVVPRVLALIFVAQWIALQAIVRVSGGLEFLEYFWVGNDFSYLYSGAGLILSGKSPYLEPNFIPLPPALYIPIALHRLPYWNAFTAFRAINLVLIFVALLWLCRELQVSRGNTVLILLITISYGPFYTLLAGGNLDGLMLCFLVFSCVRWRPGRGAFIGLSVGTKFYSLLLVPVLIVTRRWKELLWSAVTLTLLLVPFARYMPGAFGSVFHRTSVLRLEDNQSPVVLFIRIFGMGHPWLWKGSYVLLWVGTLAVRLLADWKSQDVEGARFRSLNYLPWMTAAPLLVFTYTSALLLGFVIVLTRENELREMNWARWLTLLGVVLTGVYSPLLGRLLRLAHLPSAQTSSATALVPSVAITLLLLGCGASAWIELKRNRMQAVAN